MKYLLLVISICVVELALAQTNQQQTKPGILSAYHGLDALPPRARVLCREMAGGEDGMPLTFSVQIDNASLSPDVFVVVTSEGDPVTPICATLRPAIEPLELRTVLLVGTFGNAQSPPQAVEIVGQLQDAAGNSLQGLRTETITRLEAGPSLVFAEYFSLDTFGLSGECPSESRQAILLTWEGGVTGPQGAALAEAQRTAVSVLLDSGERVHPVALGDDDPDNHVIACLAEPDLAVSVSVEAGFFHDPGDDANPATTVEVVRN